MIRANIHEVKARLSEYLARLGEGEVIIVCKRNTPIAEIRLVPPRSGKKRPIGKAAGGFAVPDSFFEPLPDDVVEAFEGKGR